MELLCASQSIKSPAPLRYICGFHIYLDLGLEPGLDQPILLQMMLVQDWRRGAYTQTAIIIILDCVLSMARHTRYNATCQHVAAGVLQMIIILSFFMFLKFWI